MSANVVIIAGAADPEMEAIERLAADSGIPVVFAQHQGHRVHPGVMYQTESLSGAIPDGATILAVECDGPAIPDAATRIDHHRPGDPGYDRPPSEFLSASSIGQVISELARLDLLPDYWPVLRRCGMPPANPFRWVNSGQGFSDRGGTHCGWAVCLPDVSDGPPDCAALVPEDLVVIAAADHCLAAAYRGECPGVDPDPQMEFASGYVPA